MEIKKITPDDADEMNEIGGKVLDLFRSLDTDRGKFYAVLLHVIASGLISRDTAVFYSDMLLKLWDEYEDAAVRKRGK